MGSTPLQVIAFLFMENLKERAIKTSSLTLSVYEPMEKPKWTVF